MKDQIVEALAVVAELTGTELSQAAMRVMVEDLAVHPTGDVLTALDRCRRECRHRLTLADVLDRLPNRPPGPEEAWELVVAARPWEEGATVVLPRAILASFPFALWPDRVAARMAFREAYPRNVERFAGEMAVSLGWDPEGRDNAIIEAVQAGLLSRDDALLHLPQLPVERLPQPPHAAAEPARELAHEAG